ncbi:hypothetical protein Tco_0343934, partial [Tanacetum coccineum]
YVRPFELLEKVGEVSYKLELPEKLSRVHNTFHVSNLNKCYADEPLAVPLDGLHFDEKLQFVEEPFEIRDCEVKWLKRSRIPLIKVRWNSKRGPEFTWEHEDQFKKKYPHLFTKTGSSSSAASPRSWSNPSEILTRRLCRDSSGAAPPFLQLNTNPLLPSGTPPLLPIPLPALSTSHRADILEADTPPQKRPLLTTPRPGCELEERVLLLQLRDRPGPTMPDLARSEAYSRALEARVTVLETQARRHEWQRQDANDRATRHIMRIQALEAGARDDTLEDTGSSS